MTLRTLSLAYALADRALGAAYLARYWLAFALTRQGVVVDGLGEMVWEVE